MIRDTLDISLDIPTISIGAASHPYTWRLEGQNILVITFDDIGLPDSGTNERKSHGIVKYRLHLKQDLAPRTEIWNRVGIYFDYNAVVMTNQVVSRTPESSSTPIDRTAPSSVRSYPRPARDLLYINGQLLPGSTVILHSIDGKIVSTGTASGSGHEKLGVSGLAAGVYLLEIETDAGRAIEPVVVAR